MSFDVVGLSKILRGVFKDIISSSVSLWVQRVETLLHNRWLVSLGLLRHAAVMPASTDCRPGVWTGWNILISRRTKEINPSQCASRGRCCLTAHVCSVLPSKCVDATVCLSPPCASARLEEPPRHHRRGDSNPAWDPQIRTNPDLGRFSCDTK